MIPDFAGRTVAIVRLDWGLHLWTEDNWEILMSAEVLVATPAPGGIEQVAVEVDVEPQPLPGALEGLQAQVVQRLLVSRQGHLGLLLPDRHLVVAPIPRYEAWQIAGPGGERLICGPRGKLVHFPPRAEPG